MQPKSAPLTDTPTTPPEIGYWHLWADAEGISASGKHGVLEIAIPKRPEQAARRIKING